MKAVFGLFYSMRLVGVTPNRRITSWAIPIFYTDKNAVNNAKDALKAMADTEPEKLDISVFNLMIHVLAVKKKYDEALSVLDQLYEIGLKPNSETLDAVLDVCIHDQDVPLGKTLYNRMISQNVEKTPSVLSKMVTLLSTSDDYEDAFKFLEEMKQLGMTPYRGAYFQLVKVLACSNDPRLDMALEDMSIYNYEQSAFLKTYIERAKERNLKEESDRAPTLSL
ncbi:hypothetical protein BY458DRAFT_295692 [Sporodiniella umbellata]|nr:hypothetical protein BY458DRAFT_295692 [Sporodiniella umbellata]